VTARERLSLVLSAELLDAMEEVVAERVRAELTARSPIGDSPKWLTVDQAAERLSCSSDAVRMRVKRGRLEHRRQGRRVYVSAESVDRIA
jgi:excisionase family DNA binding protein